MKYITQIQPYNFVISKTGIYQGLNIIEEIPAVLLDSNNNSFSYILPNDLENNLIQYTIYWIAFVTSPTLQITVNSDLHNTVIVDSVNYLWYSHVRKTIIQVSLNDITPYTFVNVNIKSNPAMSVTNVLVEGVE